MERGVFALAAGLLLARGGNVLPVGSAAEPAASTALTETAALQAYPSGSTP
jgi:hypothetical protein